MAAGPPIEVFTKDPNATEIYTIDWGTKWLGTSDTLSASAWTVSSTGIALDSDTNTTTLTIPTVSGGTAGEDYELTNRVTTVAGRITDRTIRIRVRER